MGFGEQVCTGAASFCSLGEEWRLHGIEAVGGGIGGLPEALAEGGNERQVVRGHVGYCVALVVGVGKRDEALGYGCCFPHYRQFSALLANRTRSSCTQEPRNLQRRIATNVELCCGM